MSAYRLETFAPASRLRGRAVRGSIDVAVVVEDDGLSRRCVHRKYSEDHRGKQTGQGRPANGDPRFRSSFC